jgi:hypothetical protein
MVSLLGIVDSDATQVPGRQLTFFNCALVEIFQRFDTVIYLRGVCEASISAAELVEDSSVSALSLQVKFNDCLPWDSSSNFSSKIKNQKSKINYRIIW